MLQGAQDLIRVSAQAVLGTSWTPIFTAPFQTQVAIGAIHLTNSSASAVSVNLCLVPSGITPGTGNALLWGLSLPANDFLELGSDLILLAGWMLTGQASGGGLVSVFASGYQF